MSTTLEHTTVEHPTPEQAPPPPDRWKRGVGVVALVLGLGTIIMIDLVQQPSEIEQDAFSPETHRDWTPPRADSGDNQLRSEATRGTQVETSSDNQLRSEATRGTQVETPSDNQLRSEATRGDQTGTTHDGLYPGLYAADELATMELVRTGQLPKVLLETELFITKRLANEGRIPASVR